MATLPKGQGVFLPPFKAWLASNIPAVYDNTMTYYEELVALIKYLQDIVVPAVNDNASAVTTISNAVEQLQSYVENYFANLDVQEEINNKLDQMAEDGTLQEIIAAYLDANALWCFDNITDLKAATNLTNGSFAKTLGYYAPNDNGGATYKITNTGTGNDGDVIALNNGNYAHLVSVSILPEMFGAKGDNSTNDTSAFNKAVAYGNKLTLSKGKTYCLTNLAIAKDYTIEGNGATLKDISGVDKFIANESLEGTKVFALNLNNVVIDASHSNYGIYTHTNITNVNNVKISGALTACFACYKGSTSGRYGTFTANEITCQLSPIGMLIACTDSFTSNYHGYNCTTHIDVRGGLTHLNTIHGWNFNDGSDRVTGSTLIDAKGDIVGSDIYIDTLERGVALPTGSQYQYQLISLQNVNFFINTSSYPKAQASPQIFYNVSNYNGKLHCDGLSVNANGWTDSSNNQPIIIPNVPEPRIQITNVSQDGFSQNTTYKPIMERGDIQTSDYTEDVSTYLSLGTRKYIAKDHNIKCYIIGTMKAGCPTNTIMYKCTFTNALFQRFNRTSNVYAVFHETSNPGQSYVVPVGINASHEMTVYNNTGITLGGTGHYGSLFIYIDHNDNWL